MTKLLKSISKIKITFCFLGILLFSCDFSTHEWYMFETNRNSNEEVYMIWPDSDSAECAISVADTNLNYNNIRVTFPSDKSFLDTYRESYYEYINGKGDIRTDSILKWSYYFNIKESDSRILENDYVISEIRLDNKIKRKDTLFRNKVEQSFIDRLPLPKLH